MPIHLHIACVCFPTRKAELSSCDRAWIACKAKNTLKPLQNNFAEPCPIAFLV